MLNKTKPGKSAWKVDTGQMRTHNEDNVAVMDVTVNDAEDENLSIYALADGAGGHPKGEVASQVVVHNATHRFASLAAKESPMPHDYRKLLHSSVLLANRILMNKNEQFSREMLTTLVMAAVHENRAQIVNVGDSRAYVVRKDGIQQITHDHSMIQALLDGGAISPEEVADHPYRSVLTNAIGQDEPTIDFYDVTFDDGDYLLLCSDGLWNELDDDQIWQTIRDADSVQNACEELVSKANKAGGNDNIAVVVVQIKDEPKSWPKNWMDKTLNWLHDNVLKN